jgi:hypothetical protein
MDTLACRSTKVGEATFTRVRFTWRGNDASHDGHLAV